MTLATHKNAAAAGSFCFSITEDGEQQDVCNLITMPGVQRSLYLNEATNGHEGFKTEVPDGVDGQTRDMFGTLYDYLRKSRRNKSQNEISCARGSICPRSSRWSKTSWIQILYWQRGFWSRRPEESQAEKYVTGRWVLTIKTDKQGNILKAKARWVLRGFQDKQNEYLQTDSPASTRPGFRMSCQMAAKQGWNLSHLDLKTAFLQG